MTRRRLLSVLDLRRLEQAIGNTERSSAIELRISIAGLFWGRPQGVAEKAFQRLGMTATSGRTGILLLIAPWHRRVVIVADEGITAKVDPAFWTRVVESVTAAFRAGQYTEGLVTAVEDLGRTLAPLFPPRPGDVNELPDGIDPGR
jgi:uncharacterized membrane protein